MRIEPLYDRVLVRRVEQKNQTAGGLYIPDNAKEKPTEATVLAVGPGKLLEDGSQIELAVEVGDRVLFGKYSGVEIPDGEGGEFIILREEDILAIVGRGSAGVEEIVVP